MNNKLLGAVLEQEWSIVAGYQDFVSTEDTLVVVALRCPTGTIAAGVWRDPCALDDVEVGLKHIIARPASSLATAVTDDWEVLTEENSAADALAKFVVPFEMGANATGKDPDGVTS